MIWSLGGERGDREGKVSGGGGLDLASIEEVGQRRCRICRWGKASVERRHSLFVGLHPEYTTQVFGTWKDHSKGKKTSLEFSFDKKKILSFCGCSFLTKSKSQKYSDKKETAP